MRIAYKTCLVLLLLTQTTKGTKWGRRTAGWRSRDAQGRTAFVGAGRWDVFSPRRYTTGLNCNKDSETKQKQQKQISIPPANPTLWKEQNLTA